MKILFVMRHSGYVRNFDSTLRALADRGHHVELAFQSAERHLVMDPQDTVSDLIAAYPGLSDSPAPDRGVDAWTSLANELRVALDYFPYLEPRYRDAPKLRGRAARHVARGILRLTSIARRLPGGLPVLRAALGAAERAIPRSPRIDAFVRAHAPDLVLVTPLLESESPQVDYLRSARALGIRTGLCVFSWDNLTNKGLIRDAPDLVAVWNEAMRREAIEFHKVPPDRVVVTGAPAYDQWFDWQPSTTREAFCTQVGLPADRPYVLYLCSSKFIAPAEVAFVRDWLRQLREHADPRLRELGVLVRMHPQNAQQWDGVDLAAFGDVRIWPRAGSNPVDAKTKSAYYDSMFHSVAVMGVNTSALIESGIVGRPVYTLLAPEFRETQEGTLHFRHLLHVNGGLLRVAATFDEHARQLLGALTADEAEQAREAAHNRQFIEAFVRPYGLAEPATARLVAAIEKLGEQPAPRAQQESWAIPLTRAAIRPAASFVHTRIQGGPQDRKEAAVARKPVPTKNGRHTAGPARRPEFEALSEDDRLAFTLRNLELMPDELWDRLERRPARSGLLDYASATITMRAATHSERVRLRACGKEPWTVKWIEDAIGADEVLYDIGANVGAYSLVAAMRRQKRARVVAFEPSCTTFASLCENIALNDLSDRITPLPIALSDTTSLGQLVYSGLAAGSAQHELLSNGGASTSATATVEAAPFRQTLLTYRLDDLLAQFDLPRPNHIKIDVDGTEVEVIHGASKTLASDDLRSVMIEVVVEKSDEVIRLLEAHGLRLAQRIERPNKSGVLKVWYGLFERSA